MALPIEKPATPTPIEGAASAVSAGAKSANAVGQTPAAQPLIARRQDEYSQLPDEPWEYGLSSGVRAGVQYSDAQFVAGTLEYRVRDNEQWRMANKYIFDDVKDSLSLSKAYREKQVTGANVSIDQFDPSRSPNQGNMQLIEDREAYFSSIVSKLPESERNPEGISKFIILNAQAGAKHDALYLFKFIGPTLKQQYDEGAKNWDFPDISNMSPEELGAIALKNGANPEVVQNFIVGSKSKSQSFYNTSVYNQLKPLVESIDGASELGKNVLLNPEKYLFHLPDGSFAKHEAFRMAARWKENHGHGFIKGLLEGIGHLSSTIGYGSVGVLEGAAGTLVSGVTLGNVNIQSGDTYLSDAVINGDSAKRDDIKRTLEKADNYMKTYGPELRDAYGSGDEGKQSAIINKLFGQYADSEMTKTFKDLSRYKKEGAFRPGYSAEKLAAFGEGVLDAGPAIWRFFTSSIDPGSWSFRRQVNQTYSDDPMDGILGGTFDAWVKGSKLYKEMDSDRLDRSIEVWTKNYLTQTQGNTSWVSEGYEIAASGLKAVGADTLGEIATDASKIAKGQIQDTRMYEAGQLADPLMLGAQTIRWASFFAKNAEASAAFAKASQGYKSIAGEVLYEVESAQIAGGKVNDVLQTAINSARTQLESMYPGVKITDEQIVAAALGQRNLGTFGRSASATVIRQQVGKQIAKNEVLMSKIRTLEATVDEVANAAEKSTASGRPVGGSILQGTGWTTEKLGSFTKWLGNAMESVNNPDPLSTSARKRFWFGTLRNVGKGVNLTTEGAGYVAAGYLLSQGDLLGATLSGVGGFSIAQALKPEFLIKLGTNTQQTGRMMKAIGAAGRVGEKQGQSLFLQAANNLEAEARAMGDVSTDEARMAEKAAKASDAAKLRELWRKGYEDVMLNSARVIWEDGVIGGGTGAFIAHLADRDATGSGAGYGTVMSATMRAVNRMYAMTPAGARPVVDGQIFGDLRTQMDGMPTSQRARIFQYLGDAGADQAGYRQRASIVRDLLVANRGKVTFVNEAEFAAQSILSTSTESEAALITKEAGAIYPGDPAKAAAYAARRKAQLDAQRLAQDKVTASTRDINSQNAKLDTASKQLADMKNTRASLEAAAENARKTGTKKEFEIAQKALDDHLSVESNLEMQTTLLRDELSVLQVENQKAVTEAANVVPFRHFEERVMPDGSTHQKVANGYYIETTPGREGRIVIDISKISNLEAVSEGWHSLLNSDAVKTLMPEMIQMVWGDPTSKGTIMSEALREHFFDAYTLTLTPEQAARFKTEMAVAHKAWVDGGKVDPTPLLRHTQEVMTWYMSTIDLSRRPGYRPGISTPPKLGAPTDAFSLRKLILGERGIRDVTLVKEFNLMFDADYGVFSRKSGEAIKSSLENAGMRFIEASDGTLRGYFFNNRNEIIRNPVLNSFYERVLDMTGGVGGRRLNPINLYDTRLTPTERVDFVKANGMDWVLNDAGTDILPPNEIGIKSTKFATQIRDTLANVKPGDSGMRSIPNPERPGEVVFVGTPTRADIDAIGANQDIHPTIRANTIAIMESLSGGVEKQVLVGMYNNVFSTNPEAITNSRLYIGKDIQTHTSTKQFVPLSIEFGFADVLDGEGKPVKVRDSDGKLVNLRQATTRVNVFNPQNFQASKNRGFSEGLVTRDKDGNKTGYFKSPEGKEYTAEYLKQLWVDDASLMRDANIWINHLHSVGQDPFATTATTNTPEPSAKILSPDNIAEGEAKRDALRILFGTETSDAKKSWVYANRPKANTKFAVRGSEFPLEKLRIDQLGPVTTRGDTFHISQESVGAAQLAYAPMSWDSVNIAQKNGLSGVTVSAKLVKGDAFVNGENLISNSDSFSGGGDPINLKDSVTKFDVNQKITHPYNKDLIIYKARGHSLDGDGKTVISNADYWIYSTDGGKSFKVYGKANHLKIDPGHKPYINPNTKLGAVISKVTKEIGLKDGQAWVDAALSEARKQEAADTPVEAPKTQISFIGTQQAIDIAGTLSTKFKRGKNIVFGENGKGFILNVADVAKESNVDIRDVTKFYQRLVSDGLLVSVTKDKVRTENGSYTTQYKLAKGITEEQVRKRIKDISTRTAAAEDAAKVPPGMSPDNPLYTKSEYAEVQKEREQLAYDVAYERTGVHTDPALIAEEQARLRGDRISKVQDIVLQHIDEVEQETIKTDLINKNYEKAQESARIARERSDARWKARGEKVGRDIDKAALAAEEAAQKKWYADRVAEVRAQWAWDEAAIRKVEQERLEAHREQQRQEAAQKKQTESERKAYQIKMDKLDAEIIARKRALREMVDNVVGEQALSDYKVQKLHAEFIASGQPVIAPGLLLLDNKNGFYGASRVTSGVPTTEIPVYLTQRYAATQNPPGSSAANNWLGAYAQQRFDTQVAGIERGKPALNRFYEGTTKMATMLEGVNDKIWDSEGGSMLVAQIRKAKADAGGNLTTYKVYGVNGNSVYTGNNATDALRALKENDEKQKASQAVSSEKTTFVEKNSNFFNARGMQIKSPYKSNVDELKKENENLGKRYNRPTK